MTAAKAACALFAAALQIAAGQARSASEPSVQTLLEEAGNQLTTGRFQDAASRFRAILARRPDLPEALFGLGIASTQLGRLPEAEGALRRYVKLRPSADGHAALGTVLLAAGSRSQARSELERALSMERNNLEAAKALAHIETGDYNGKRAVELLKPFAASPDFDDEARLLLAGGYAESGEPRLAASLLSPILDRRPPPAPEAFALVAASAHRAGDAATAERACGLGLRFYLNSDEIEQHCVRTVSTAFVRELESSLRGTAADVPALIVLGRIMTDVAENALSPIRDRALEFLQKAAALAPGDPSVRYNLGRCLRVMARSEQAIAEEQRALAAQPDPELQVLIYTQIALAEQYLQHDDKAEAAFRRALEINRRLARHLPAAAFEYCAFLELDGKPREAGAVTDEILRWDAGFLPARLQRARSLAADGKLAEAAAEGELVARSVEPGNAKLLRQTHIFLMRTYASLGRPEDAAREEAWVKKERAKQL